METKAKAKGTWFGRFAIRFFTLVMGMLVFWLLGFFLQDIRTIRGPDYAGIEKQYVDAKLTSKMSQMEKEIADLQRDMTAREKTLQLLGDGSRSLQQTISQLLDLRKLGLEKNIPFSEVEQQDFTSSLSLFLENQKKYQAMNQALADLHAEVQRLEAEKRQVEGQITVQRGPARKEFNTRSAKHRLKLAFYQLLVLIPLLAAAAVLTAKKRGSIYFPFVLAFGAATLLKVGLVVHEYFPKRYFKYILVAALLLAVGRLLVHLIRQIAFPKPEWLAKQHREAYERFLCPVCEYPIRTGPRRFLFWTRRSVAKLAIPTGHDVKEEPYTCPACGTGLIAECSSCHRMRHSLLPHCQHCGASA